MAVFRGAQAVGPVSRYFDFHALGLAANAASLVLLGAASGGSAGPRRWLPRSCAAVWVVAATWGSALHLNATFRSDLPEAKSYFDVHAANVFRAVVGKDRTVLVPGQTRYHLPYPDPEALRQYLEDPKVFALLPAAYRIPPDPAPAPACDEGCFLNPRLPEGLPTPPVTRLLASSYQPEGQLRGRFVSAPIHASTEWLQFWYLGKDTGGSIGLRLVPVGTGKAIKVDRGFDASTGQWRPVTVRVSKGKDYQVEFKDDSDNAWGALTEPVPLAPWSRRAEILGAHALWLLLGTFGLWIVLAAARASAPSSGGEKSSGA
jgi:hypothetical protein